MEASGVVVERRRVHSAERGQEHDGARTRAKTGLAFCVAECLRTIAARANTPSDLLSPSLLLTANLRTDRHCDRLNSIKPDGPIKLIILMQAILWHVANPRKRLTEKSVLVLPLHPRCVCAALSPVSPKA